MTRFKISVVRTTNVNLERLTKTKNNDVPKIATIKTSIFIYCRSDLIQSELKEKDLFTVRRAKRVGLVHDRVGLRMIYIFCSKVLQSGLFLKAIQILVFFLDNTQSGRQDCLVNSEMLCQIITCQVQQEQDKTHSHPNQKNSNVREIQVYGD